MYFSSGGNHRAIWQEGVALGRCEELGSLMQSATHSRADSSLLPYSALPCVVHRVVSDRPTAL